MQRVVYLGIYIVLATIMLIVEYNNLVMLRYIVKPLLMLMLIAYVLSGTISNLHRTLLVVALSLSCMGDVFLLFPNYQLAFTLGLIAFLCAHLSYICLFWQDIKLKNSFRWKRVIILSIIVLIYAVSLYHFMYPYLGEMLVPVTIYMLVILTMALSAILRYNNASYISFLKVTYGSLLFLISDSMLALDKFVNHFALASFWVMLSYMLAQLLIANGIIKLQKSQLGS